ncbi:hypothetical protein ANME2D_02472 [Candidatus Methanoperedens nitroreducens]|uniref:Uncharacterized protein n=1 Tax=Candidatus Methanoperedens nitratireducens TaxID=1392998 RepID=A0A062V799_9EURY|nr:hypothetical protein ANME2D_02472 [Candidatus Methanoperedens nitroreducens]
MVDNLKEMKVGDIKETRSHSEWLKWVGKNITKDY